MKRFAAPLLIAAAALLAACRAAGPAPELALEPVYPQQVGSDAAMAAMLEPYRIEVAKWDIPIGHSAVQMTVDKRREELGFWIADVLFEEVPLKTGQKLDGLFLNSAGARSTLPKGQITYRTIAEILPFDNTIVIFTMDAAQVRTMAEHLALSEGTNSISNMTVDADADKKLLNVTIGGEPLREGHTYTIATNNYLAVGGGGFKFLPAWPHTETKLVVREMVADHVRRLEKEGREIQLPPGLPRYHFPPPPEAKTK